MNARVRHHYTIPNKIVDQCRLGGTLVVTRVVLRALTAEEIEWARVRSDNCGFKEKKMLMLLTIHALERIELEGQQWINLDPASENSSMRPYEIYKRLPLRLIRLLELAVTEHLSPRIASPSCADAEPSFVLQLDDVSAEDIALATFDALKGAATAHYQALSRTEPAAALSRRLGLAREAFMSVVVNLPSNNPYRTELLRYLDEEVVPSLLRDDREPRLWN